MSKHGRPFNALNNRERLLSRKYRYLRNYPLTHITEFYLKFANNQVFDLSFDHEHAYLRSHQFVFYMIMVMVKPFGTSGLKKT